MRESFPRQVDKKSRGSQGERGLEFSRRRKRQTFFLLRRTVQKDLHDPDNHDGVITHLEPDILECEVKWALESIITNKASGGDGIPVELFQILKDDAVKVWGTEYASKFGKLSSGHRTRKGQFSFQSRRKAMPKNAQTTTQLHSTHRLGKQCSKFSKPGFIHT